METKHGKQISVSDEVGQEETSLKLSKAERKEMDFLIANVYFFIVTNYIYQSDMLKEQQQFHSKHLSLVS